ncbi:MAG: hypothetical protein NTZ33_15710 [Bacteroidetes bacterium]|nr:hypothetical protein [Bacteroidota bacterium]
MKIKTDKYILKWIKLAGFILAGFILSYFLAFSNTIQLYKQSNENNSLIIEANELPFTIKKLERKVKENEEKKFKVSGLDSLTSRQKILDLFASASSEYTFSVKEVSPTYVSSQDSLNTELSVFTLEGNFFELLKTWHFIENQLYFGKINAGRFYVNEDFRLNIKKLNLILYVELLKNKKK